MALIGRNVIPRVMKIPRLTDQDLGRLDLPMLVIIGGKDVLINSEETCRRLSRHVPMADVRFLLQARHFIPAQAEPILQFLTDLQTPQI